MMFYASAILLLIAGVACSATPRILGGTSASIQEYPCIVQVESTTAGISWSQSCAGSILNNRFVLSAAQCFSGSLYATSRRRIRAGTASRGSGGSVFSIARVFSHPDYSSSTNEADLTIVEIDGNFVWSDSIQPVAIVPQDFELPDHLPVVMAGWGRYRSGLFGGSSSTLQHVTVEKVNHESCKDIYLGLNKVVSDDMMCTGLSDSGFDSCDGDEGGPVYYIDTNGQVFLVGVISWRQSCGAASVPSVNTRIASYTNWIVINAT